MSRVSRPHIFLKWVLVDVKTCVSYHVKLHITADSRYHNGTQSLHALRCDGGFFRNWSLARMSWYLVRVRRSLWPITRFWTRRDMNFSSTWTNGGKHIYRWSIVGHFLFFEGGIMHNTDQLHPSDPELKGTSRNIQMFVLLINSLTHRLNESLTS